MRDADKALDVLRKAKPASRNEARNRLWEMGLNAHYQTAIPAYEEEIGRKLPNDAPPPGPGTGEVETDHRER